MINTVKLQSNGWLVNGNMSVPNDINNSDCKAVLRWLEGKTDAWLALEETFNTETATHDNWLDITTYEARLAQYEIDIVAYNDWVAAGSLEPALAEPVFPVKPEGYYTQAEVDASETLQRPVDLIEPTITPLPALVPNVPEPEDPPPPPPTLDEVYDQAIQNSKVLKAVILALNDGTFVPGSNYTNTQIKNGIKSRM